MASILKDRVDEFTEEKDKYFKEVGKRYFGDDWYASIGLFNTQTRLCGALNKTSWMDV